MDITPKQRMQREQRNPFQNPRINGALVFLYLRTFRYTRFLLPLNVEIYTQEAVLFLLSQFR